MIAYDVSQVNNKISNQISKYIFESSIHGIFISDKCFEIAFGRIDDVLLNL